MAHLQSEDIGAFYLINFPKYLPNGGNCGPGDCGDSAADPIAHGRGDLREETGAMGKQKATILSGRLPGQWPTLSQSAAREWSTLLCSTS